MESKIDIILKKHNADFLSYIENNNGFFKGFDFLPVFKEIEENLINKNDFKRLVDWSIIKEKELNPLFCMKIINKYTGSTAICK
jgi:hypothetical protein